MKLRGGEKYLISGILKLISRMMKPVAGRGSSWWLIATELKYGGPIMMARQTGGKDDPRNHEAGQVPEWAKDFRQRFNPMIADEGELQHYREEGIVEIGGDRMAIHRYAFVYSRHLKKFLSMSDIVVAEIGILGGGGLAIWADLFPNGRICGFDLDPNNYRHNENRLLSRGAFKNKPPEVYQFDQYDDNRRLVEKILNGDKINICIDDGDHSSDAIICTIRSMRPHLAEDFVYFVEDNREVHTELRQKFPELRIRNYKQMTVLTP